MAAETEVERLVVRLTGDSTSYQRMLRTAGAATKQATAQFAMAGRSVTALGVKLKALGVKMAMVGKGMRSMGTKMAGALTLPIAVVAGAGVYAFAKFDKAMTESTAIMKVTAEQAERMRKTALSLSTAGGGTQGATELAESYYFLASAGKNAEQSMALLPAVAQFATAGAFDMAKATDLLTDAQSALGLSSKDAAKDTENLTRVSDALVKSGTLANASVQQFAEALTADAATASLSLGQSLESTLAILALYADKGKKAAEAGNLYGRATRLLTKASRANADQFKKHNVKVIDAATGEYRDFIDILDDMNVAFKGMTGPQRAAALEQMGFAALAQKSILPLLDSTTALKGYKKELEGAGGQTAKTATKQMKSFSNQLKVLKNRLVNVGIEIGKVLAPMIEKLSGWISSAVKWWNTLNASTKKTIIVVALVVAALGPILIIGGMLVSAIGAIVSAIGSVIAFLGPWGVAIVALIGTIGGLTLSWDDVLGAVKGFVMGAIGFVIHFRENMGILWKWLKDNWGKILLWMFEAWVQVNLNMAYNLGVGIKTLVRLYVAFQGWLSGMFERAFSKEFLKWVFIGLAKVGQALLDFAEAAWETLKGIFTGAAPTMGDFMDQLKDDFDKGAENINFIETAGDIISEEAKNLKGPLEGMWSDLEGPQFNLETGFNKAETKKVAKDVAEDAAKAVEKAVDKKVDKEIKANVHYSVSGIGAVEAGTAEAMARVREFMSLKPDANLDKKASLEAAIKAQEARKAQVRAGGADPGAKQSKTILEQVTEPGGVFGPRMGHGKWDSIPGNPPTGIAAEAAAAAAAASSTGVGEAHRMYGPAAGAKRKAEQQDVYNNDPANMVGKMIDKVKANLPFARAKFPGEDGGQDAPVNAVAEYQKKMAEIEAKTPSGIGAKLMADAGTAMKSIEGAGVAGHKFTPEQLAAQKTVRGGLQGGDGAGFLGLSPQEFARINAENKAAEASKRARAANPWLDKRVKSSESVIQGVTPKSQAPKPDMNLVNISSGIDKLVELAEEQNKLEPVTISGAGL